MNKFLPFGEPRGRRNGAMQASLKFQPNAASKLRPLYHNRGIPLASGPFFGRPKPAKGRVHLAIAEGTLKPSVGSKTAGLP